MSIISPAEDEARAEEVVDDKADPSTVDSATEDDIQTNLARLLRKHADELVVSLAYHGDQETIYHSLMLEGPLAPPRGPLSTGWFGARLSRSQVLKLVEHLAKEGHLRRSLQRGLEAFTLPPGPTYTLTVEGPIGATDSEREMLYEVLGWNLTMLDRLESLAASLDGEAIQKLTKLIARLDGHRNEWKADKVRLLDGLRARAENRESFDRVSTKAFEDILELRATGTADAVPVLVDILSDNAGTGRIHGHAAEQALFCIGTPSAFKVLDQRLLEDNYGILRSAGYAHGWKMAEPLRSGFIERYLLRNLSKDLSIEVQAASSAEEEGRIDFVVTLRNVSQEIFQIVDRQIYHGDLLFLRSADSQFVRSMQYVDYDAPKGR